MDSTQKRNQLELLKNRILFGVDDNDTVQTRTLVQLMEKVGGYEQLMNMRLPAVFEVIKVIKWQNKQLEKRNKSK